MKRFFWILIVTLLLVAGVREAYFQVMPNVTIENRSEFQIDSAVVQLPSNRLSFGIVLPGNSQTIYRSLKQNDGEYQYKIVVNSGVELSGKCGYVTSNELFIRFLIIVGPANNVTCSG